MRRNILITLVIATAVALMPAPASADLTADDEFWDLASAADDDFFGWAVASGDFDDDGYIDLAIGCPGREVNGFAAAGVVKVLYGDADGITGTGQQSWHQDSAGIDNVAETADHFGSALAAGDFDGDGYTDLAVGAHQEDLGTVDDAGVVHILYGGSGGLSSAGSLVLHQGNGMLDIAEADDHFGYAIVTGDFDGNGYDDLAIGVPFEDIGAISAAGAAHVLYGGVAGLTTTGQQLWHQNSPGTSGGAEEGDLFGAALAAGDFDGDGRDDLVIGLPHEDMGTVIVDAGAVHVLRGSYPAGLVAADDQVWTQDSPEVTGICEDGDFFGGALTAGDFNADGSCDLVIGARGEDFESPLIEDAGVLNVLYGGAGGLSATDEYMWYQNRPGMLDTSEADDGFGAVLAVGDFDGSGYVDLAIGIKDEDIDTIGNAGATAVMYGTSQGLGAAGNQFLYQSGGGLGGWAEPSDAFGYAVAAGDFNGDGADDLAVGVPFEDLGAVSDAGTVQVIYAMKGLFSDGFESGDTSGWDSSS